MGSPKKERLLSLEEIRQSFEGPDAASVAPILSIKQVAALLGVGVGTVRHWLLHDRLEGTYRKRGKRLFFSRDKVLDLLFNGPDWK